MAAPKRTQKEHAERYKGNLGYFRKPHVFRTLRLVLFVLVAFASLALALGYRRYGKKEFFSTGPISANHERFANRCEVCHADADPDLMKALRVDTVMEKVHEGKFSELIKFTKSAGDAQNPHSTAGSAAGRSDLESPQELLAATGTLSRYDAACIKCHEPFQLHQPQLAALGLRAVYNEIGLVHAGSCSTCHREHQGPAKMKLPPSNNCSNCHNDPQRLAEGLALMRSAAKLASPRGETRDLGDGVRRFIPPRAAPHVPVAFATFEKGHPSFGYEQPGLRDPAKIQFNHARHMQADVTGANGKQLECTQCHRSGADGKFMQRVVFETDCQRCHSLNFDPDAPKLALPHGDPEKVRAYLRSLTSLYVDFAISQLKISDRTQLEAYVKGQFDKLHARGLSTAEELERRVFYTGDPPETPRLSTKSNKGQFFPGCAKCHEIKPNETSGAPRVTPTNLADRWLTRGPFTHAPHLHMQCTDCHGVALASTKTSDILLPAKQICAECHRPLQHATAEPAVVKADTVRTNEPLALRQRQEGGILAECQSCHPKYHAPTEATVYAKELRK